MKRRVVVTGVGLVTALGLGSEETWRSLIRGVSGVGPITRFDAADYLDSEEMIAEYLAAALEDSNPDVFLSALGDIAKARGMAKIAKDAGLSRESLYKALAPGAKPRYETVRKLMDAIGVKMTAQSAVHV